MQEWPDWAHCFDSEKRSIECSMFSLNHLVGLTIHYVVIHEWSNLFYNVSALINDALESLNFAKLRVGRLAYHEA